MENKLSKTNNYFVFTLMLLVFIISFFQMISQHWSAHFDSDWFNIYNILLVKSGYKQSFYGHPAFPLYFINSIILRIYDLINSNLLFNIDYIENVENLDLYFEKIFYVARTINAIIHCLSIYFLYLILNKLKTEKWLNFLILLVFICSNFFLINLFQIRPEIYSIFFFLVSFLLILNSFDNDKKIILIFLAGFLSGLAYISKIQVIFFIFFIFFIFPFLSALINKKNLQYENNFLLNKKKLFNFSIVLYFFICVVYILIEYFIIYNHPRYIDHQKIDLYGFLLFNFLYFFYLKFLSKKNNYAFNVNVFIAIIFFLGFITTVLFLTCVNFLEISKVNHNIYFKFLNPYYFLNTRTIDGSLIETLALFFNPKLIINNVFFWFSIFLLIPFYKKLINLKYFYLLIALGLLILNIFANNLRYFYLYEIYTFIAFVTVLGFTNQNIISKFRYFIAITLLLITNHNTFYKNDFKKYFHRVSMFNECKTNEWPLLNRKNGGISYWTPWTPKFSEQFYYEICLDTIKDKNL